MNLTPEEELVISEYLDEAIKRRSKTGSGGIRRIHEYSHRMLYNHRHGVDAGKKLLVNYILHLKESDPDNPKIDLLETVIPKSRFHTWILESEYRELYGEIPIDKITYDGFGYFYLSTGFRIDSDDDLYKSERLKFNYAKQNLN